MTEEQIRKMIESMPSAALVRLASEGTVPSRFVYDEFLSRTKGGYSEDNPTTASVWLRGYAAGNNDAWVDGHHWYGDTDTEERPR